MHLVEYLRGKIDESTVNTLERISLKSIYLSFLGEIDIADINLLIAELPKILKFNDPTVKDIISASIELISDVLDAYRVYDPYAWQKFVNLKYLIEMLKIVDDLKK